MKIKYSPILLILNICFFANYPASFYSDQIQFCQTHEKTNFAKLPGQCSQFCQFAYSTCERQVLKTNDPMKLCSQEQYRQFNALLDSYWLPCLSGSGDTPLKIKQRMYNFINQGFAKLSQPLSADELIKLRGFIRNLEKEGLLPEADKKEAKACEPKEQSQAIVNKKVQELVKQGIVLAKIIGDLEKEGITISNEHTTSPAAGKEEL